MSDVNAAINDERSSVVYEATMTRVLASKKKRCPDPLVLLHGWGCDSRSWQPLLESLTTHLDVTICSLPGFSFQQPLSSNLSSTIVIGLSSTYDDYLEALLAQLPERFYLAGWSLGGMLATRLAAKAPHRVQGLITLASNLCFVERTDWPMAMGSEVFDAFAGGFEQSPTQTLKRFAGLMSKGDARERELLKSLRRDCSASWQSCIEQDTGSAAKVRWLAGLQWLQQIDNRQIFSQISVPGLHFLADRDALVPAGVALELAQLNATQKVEVIQSACHALHWSDPDKVLATINQFIDQAHYAVDKSKVAGSFGRAAKTYDSVAGLQRQIGHCLLQNISTPKDHSSRRWLDLGCGTGYFTPKIRERLCRDHGETLGLDLSHGMLEYARENREGPFSWLCADAENLPLQDSSLTGVFSSLAIQWCADLPRLFQELARVLNLEGEVHIATLGPRTLTELRQAWHQVDDYTHVNRFAEEQMIRDAIDQSELSIIDWQCEDIVLQYDQVRELTYELKTLGAHNMNHGQSSGLTGRQRIIKFKRAYESFRQADGKLPATYEVFYIRLKKV
ncbi:MAG: malonyl-ACP O-methyltransferase BioC [Cellvibrionaceae bacterium]